MNRRHFMALTGAAASSLAWQSSARAQSAKSRPNILFCIADDWGWPHAGAYGDPAVKTPAFDRIAAEGVLFEHAYVSSPSCTPCRNSILTGQHFWRLEDGANLWSTLDTKFAVYPLLLQKAGYHIGHWRKCWGPGDLKAGGYRSHHPHGKHVKGFKAFMDARPAGKPFCFWLGASDPHRPYKAGTGKASGMDLSKIHVPEFWPDAPEIRSDIADYYFEVQRFDRDVGQALALLEQRGELDNTIVVMTGDHGMPFPRCKSNLYEWGVHVPLAIRWGGKIKGARRVTDFVSLIDLAPTFLDAAGVAAPGEMVGTSLMPVLQSGKAGRVVAARDHMIFGKERHVPAQKAPSMGGYPCRGIRVDRYLYIRNFEPDRWPAGVVEGGTHPMGAHADCDNGPTKSYLVQNREKPDVKAFYDLSFAKRPAEELYDVERDPYQLKNLAGDPALAGVKADLNKRLTAGLKTTADPRATGGPVKFDDYRYRAGYMDRRLRELGVEAR